MNPRFPEVTDNDTTVENFPDGPLGPGKTVIADMQTFFRAEVIERDLRESLGKALGDIDDINIPQDPAERAAYMRQVILPSAEELLRELCGQNQSLYDPKLYLTYLQLLNAHGMYRKGAQMGALLYEFLAEKIKDDMFFMQLIADAGWMHYASVGVGEDEAFGQWHTRAAALYSRMARSRTRLDKKDSMSIERRKQFMIGEIKMLLMKARIAWKKGQSSSNREQKIDLCGDAMLDCNMMLGKDRQWLGALASDASEVEKIMRMELEEDLEYQAVISEARRMKAMMLGLSYQLNSWGMEDFESAEIALSESAPYVQTLTSTAQPLLEQYFDFYASRPELLPPRELWFAYIENIRQRKILGKHADAHRFGMQVWKIVQQSEDKKNDEIYRSRILAAIADNQVAIAQKLLIDNACVPEAISILEESKVALPSPPVASALAKLLFEQVRQISIVASKLGDNNTKRIARDTAAEATLPLIVFSADRGEKIRLVREIWMSFCNEDVQYEFMDEPERLRFQKGKLDDGLWKYIEASQLCRLAQHAKTLELNDIDIKNYCGGSDQYYRAALDALRAEADKKAAIEQTTVRKRKTSDRRKGFFRTIGQKIGWGPSEHDSLVQMYARQQREEPYIGPPIPMRYFKLVEEKVRMIEEYLRANSSEVP